MGSQRSLASTGGREARPTSSRLLTRTATALFPLTSGSALPTRTTRAKLYQLPLTRPTRTPSLPTAKRWETLHLRLQEDILVQLEVLPGCGRRPRWPGVWRRVCDDDRDLDGEPEEARLAGSFPNPRREGCLL